MCSDDRESVFCFEGIDAENIDTASRGVEITAVQELAWTKDFLAHVHKTSVDTKNTCFVMSTKYVVF